MKQAYLPPRSRNRFVEGRVTCVEPMSGMVMLDNAPGLWLVPNVTNVVVNDA